MTSKRLVLTLAMLVAGPAAVAAQRTPATGMDVLRAMHDAYAGKWFTTLTFTQKTTSRGRDGNETVSTWYESLRYTDATGAQLRIDTGDPAVGNGVLYSGDSLWVMRLGAVANHIKGGNELVPLIETVYMQPVARTVTDLAPANVDLSRATVTSSWNGRPVWIVGVTSAADTTSPQFWVDVERKATVRAILVAAPGTPSMDMHLDNLVAVGGGWLATKCSFFINGVRIQMEEYSHWKANEALPASLFDVMQWTTGPHWAKSGH